MTVEVKLYVPQYSEDLSLGIMIWKNGRGFLFSLEEAEKIAQEIFELLSELKNMRREAKSIAH